MKGVKFFIAIGLIFTCRLGFADYYKRGGWICNSFKEAEQDYSAHPESKYTQAGYALCLIAKGEDDKGLSILYHSADFNQNVYAAFLIASYIGSDGTFENALATEKVNEAITAYFKVLALINLGIDYPRNGYREYETESQMELTAYHRITTLFSNKFIQGARGAENSYLLRSPSYKGDRNLDTYPEYSPYTIDSLQKTIRHASRCLTLPKKPHFQADKYEKTLLACRVVRDRATALLSLEQKRLNILAQESCHRDLPQCVEYEEIRDEMVSLIKQSHAKIKDIWGVEYVVTAERQ